MPNFVQDAYESSDFAEELLSIFFEFVVAAAGTAAASARIGAGPAIRRIYLRHYRLINIFLAVTLLECVYNILK